MIEFSITFAKATKAKGGKGEVSEVSWKFRLCFKESLRRSDIMIVPKPETSLCCVTVWDLDFGEAKLL